MDRRIRLVFAALIACFSLLFLQLNNLQVRQASALDASPYQPPPPGATDPYAKPRGDIVTADGHVIATEVASHKNDGLGPIRRYPYGTLFAHVTGYFDVVDSSATGLEGYYNSYLVKHQAKASNLKGLLTEQAGTDTVATTILYSLQKVAADALAPYPDGAVVAIDPSTGAILAMYGKPTFNPNKMASHDPKAVANYYKSLNPASGASPLVNPAVGRTYPPGSTFKIITTSAIFDHKPKIETQVFPNLTALKLPETNLRLHNFAGERCGGALAVVLAVSCDTAYAKIGLELGAKNLEAEARAFGFNKPPPIDLPSSEVATPCFPPVENTPYDVPSCPPASTSAIGPNNRPGIAYSAIGQENVSESALQDALIAATIANRGVMMTPHLMGAIVNNQGQVVTAYHPHAYRTATSSDTADAVRQLMVGVADHGTAAGLFPPSIHAAAKTGTAEQGTSGCSSTWLVATAPAGPGDTPKIAVAAVVPSQSAIGCSETGAGIAGPIVAKVVDAYLGVGG